MFGVDNTFLSKVVDAKVFDPYSAEGLGDVPKELTALVPGGEATPVDVGDVCINVDKAWFDEHQLAPPADLDALADPAYKDLLVVENPSSSSPGLAFLLATIVPTATTAGSPTGSSCGPTACRSSTAGPTPTTAPSPAAATAPSRSSSATPAARPPRSCSPIRRSRRRRRRASTRRASGRSSSPGCCAAPRTPTRPASSSTSCVSSRFQSALPLNLFVYPANSTVELPEVFTANASLPAAPATMDPATIGANRQAWLDTWTDAVLR